MIDIRHERLQSLRDACAGLPGRPHVSTAIRWWRRGLKGVKLETVLVGGRRYTSEEAVERFLYRLNENKGAAPGRRQQATEIEGQLDLAGIR